jgi:hypothetical protein
VAYHSLRVMRLVVSPDGPSQDRLDVLFHSDFVSAGFSRNLGPPLTGLQQQKDVSFWICQGTVPGVVEIGREWRRTCAGVLNS